MTWIIFYILIAALVTFALRVAVFKLDISDSFGDTPTVMPVICGIFWPVAAPIYAAYIAAEWFADKYDA